MELELNIDFEIQDETYGYICFFKNEQVSIHATNNNITGLLALWHERDQVASHIGFEDFEFWVPIRRPNTFLLCFKADPPLQCFQPENVINGIYRPTTNPNAWVADIRDSSPTITLKWDEKYGNYLSTNRIKLEEPIKTTEIKISITKMCGDAPAAMLGVRCY